MDLLAAYAAAVATGGLAWQVYLWHQRRRSDLEVEVRHDLSREDSDRVALYSEVHQDEATEAQPVEDDFLDVLAGRSELRYGLTVVVTNRGESPEFIDVIGLRESRASAPIVFDPPEEKALPAARSTSKTFFVERLPSLPREFVGFAGLGEQVVESSPQTLNAELLRSQEQAS